MLDFEALSLGLLGLPRKSLPRLWGTIKYGFHLFTPLVLLVYMLLIHGASPILSALVALAGTIVASWVRSDTRMGPRKIIRSAANGPLGVLEVATACGTAGILIGVLTMTGLGLKFVSLLLSLSGHQLIILLILTMVVCIILGMGMPTPAAFILCASVAASALVQAQVSSGVLPGEQTGARMPPQPARGKLWRGGFQDPKASRTMFHDGIARLEGCDPSLTAGIRWFV